ncbi:peptidylprolyl isomerase [Desulfovibrio sp. TomC]|uniref:peptidylprolyl isomerase n=1 Tax=Desulfovibrio sp. TomC TaxID=1562888 RepID=UPI000573D728|nr:peptidylprolyl isomerase [Desulfovibrio sp. TomC]KHK02787.1 Peptidyl-prolyl cis-trans isomerase PpiB [Desulfovibrio sp. TomC]
MVSKGRVNWLGAILALCCVLAVTLGGTSAAWAKGGNPMVKLTTNKGDIVIELDQEKAPISSANFLNYVKKGHYDGLIFHRVIPGFMIQGGGMDKTMKEKSTDAPIQNEAKNGLKNKAYTLAMARTGDPHSATAQFFINVADNGFLDYPGQDGWGYAVFGKVVSGQEVVDAIKAVPTMTKGFHENVPVSPVVIEKAEVVSE